MLRWTRRERRASWSTSFGFAPRTRSTGRSGRLVNNRTRCVIRRAEPVGSKRSSRLGDSPVSASPPSPSAGVDVWPRVRGPSDEGCFNDVGPWAGSDRVPVRRCRCLESVRRGRESQPHRHQGVVNISLARASASACVLWCELTRWALGFRTSQPPSGFGTTCRRVATITPSRTSRPPPRRRLALTSMGRHDRRSTPPGYCEKVQSTET